MQRFSLRPLRTLRARRLVGGTATPSRLAEATIASIHTNRRTLTAASALWFAVAVTAHAGLVRTSA